MSQPTGLELDRTRLQGLYARGNISLDEYDVLGRYHGFIKTRVQPSVATRARSVASWAGVAMLVLGAVAQVAATRRPDLKGPLDALVEVAELVTGQL